MFQQSQSIDLSPVNESVGSYSLPYVVSSDLDILWSRAGFAVPVGALAQFRRGLTNCLQSIFGRCDYITEAELKDGVEHLLTDSKTPVVSLDMVYAHHQKHCMDTTRLHDPKGKQLGSGSRTGELGALERQVNGIVKNIGGDEIALVDDVLFSGELCQEIVRLFAAHGIRVSCIYAGVAIGEGINKMRTLGCEVKAVRAYETVVDQVCERDFMPGAPMSGRTVEGLPNTGMPYLLPYGKPLAWASIPSQSAAKFSATCLELTAEFYRGLGMRAADLPRNIHGLEVSGDAFLCDHLVDVAKGLS